MTLTGAGAASVSVLTITAVNLSGNTFTGGAASGTVVGTISVTVTGGSFTGSLSLTGADAASFQIVGTSLETNGVVATGTYSINIVATQAGAVGSPFTQPETITGGSGGSTITFTSLTNSQDGTQAALVGTYTGSAPSGLGTQSWGGGTGCSGTPTITSFVASAGNITANVAALSTGDIGCTFTATGTGANTGTGTATAVVWPSGIALIAHTQIAGAATGGTSAALRTTGATLIAATPSYFHTGSATVVDSNSVSFTGLTAAASAEPSCQLFYLSNPTTGPGYTVNATVTAGATEIMAFSKVNTSSPLDNQQSGVFNGGNNVTAAPPITPGQANTLFVSMLGGGTGSSAPVTIGSGFTGPVDGWSPFVGGTAEGMGAAWFVQGAAASLSPTWTITGSASLATCLATFKP